MFISRPIAQTLDKVFDAHLFAHHCVINRTEFGYDALSVDIREETPRITMSRVALMGVLAIAAKKRTAYVTFQDWRTGARTTVKITGNDIQRAYEFKNALQMEQVFAFNSQKVR